MNNHFLHCLLLLYPKGSLVLSEPNLCIAFFRRTLSLCLPMFWRSLLLKVSQHLHWIMSCPHRFGLLHTFCWIVILVHVFIFVHDLSLCVCCCRQFWYRCNEPSLRYEKQRGRRGLFRKGFTGIGSWNFALALSRISYSAYSFWWIEFETRQNDVISDAVRCFHSA